MLRGILTKIKSPRNILQRTFGTTSEKDEKNTEKTLSQFSLVDEQKFDGFDLTFKKYIHKSSGMVHYHLESDDNHKSMAFIFKTMPEDASGKPRMLEKMVLCGSEKYPVRDPFAHMTNRSMNSFADAWTGPDFTSYMFSTTNNSDFMNLLDVYSNAIFKPSMNKLDFLNSVWRPDLERYSATQSRIVMRGEGVGELRSLSADPYNLSIEGMVSELYKNSLYSNPACGNLTGLSELNLPRLKQYFSKAYHPSNCTIYTYGNIELPLLHEYLQKNCLNIFDKSSPKTEWNMDHEWRNQPITVVKKIPLSNTGKDVDESSIVSIGWLCTDMDNDSSDAIGLNILATLLLELPESPFYKEFLEKGLSRGYCPGYGFEQNLKRSYFQLGFIGVTKGKEDEFLKKIEEVLMTTAEKKFDKETILSIIHQIETQAKAGKLNFGLEFLQSYIGFFNHRSDNAIKSALDLKKSLNYIKGKIEAGQPYFENLLKKYLLENRQKVNLKMITDDSFMVDLETSELEIGRNLNKSLSENEKSLIDSNNAELEEEMNKIQDINVLPSLTLKDFSQEGEKTKFSVESIKEIPIYFFEGPTRGVTYLKLKLDLSTLSRDDIYYLYLAGKIFRKIGTFSLKHNQFGLLQQLYLSDLDFKLIFEGTPSDENSTQGFGILSASSLDTNIDKLFEIISLLLTEPDFKDLSHLSSLIKIEAIEAANRLGTEPLQYSIIKNESKQRPSRQIFNEFDAVDFT